MPFRHLAYRPRRSLDLRAACRTDPFQRNAALVTLYAQATSIAEQPDLVGRERDFQAWLVRCCDVLDLLVYHVPDSRRAQSGFPDTIVANGRGWLAAFELKRAGKYARADQRGWLDAFSRAGIYAQVVRPQNAVELLDTLTQHAQAEKEQ